jgi:murein L,D-transpeptidase YcbB/YkuD
MTVDPGQINWDEKSWSEVNAMRMVQGSGRTNPLGQVRVLMDNPYNIYLHDTPSKSYFTRANRALSSGCVRMSDAKAVADFILSPNEGWSTSRMDQILKNGKRYDLSAEKRLPVYILYQTVWLGSDGQIVYGPDLYGHDRKLLNELNKIGGVVYPVKDEATKTALYEESSISPLDLLTRKD